MSLEEQMMLQPLYVDVEPDEDTKRALHRLQARFKLPNPLNTQKMHCTLIYSRMPCKTPKIFPNRVFNAEFEKFDVFEQRNGKKCLVLKLKSPDLLKRHQALMDEMEASYDFDDYLPHITLSYDIEDFDIEQLKRADLIEDIFFSGEKVIVLDKDYA